MSWRTSCNFCTLRGMKVRAAKRGVTVILGRDEHGWVTATYSDQEEPSSHFMELGSRCEC